MNPLSGLIPTSGQSVIILLLTIWTFVWKGLALWHAAQYKNKQWFVAILVLNTLGVLEIAYLFIFSKNKLSLDQVIKYIRNNNWFKAKKHGHS